MAKKKGKAKAPPKAAVLLDVEWMTPDYIRMLISQIATDKVSSETREHLLLHFNTEDAVPPLLAMSQIFINELKEYFVSNPRSQYPMIMQTLLQTNFYDSGVGAAFLRMIEFYEDRSQQPEVSSGVAGGGIVWEDRSHLFINAPGYTGSDSSISGQSYAKSEGSSPARNSLPTSQASVSSQPVVNVKEKVCPTYEHVRFSRFGDRNLALHQFQSSDLSPGLSSTPPMDEKLQPMEKLNKTPTKEHCAILESILVKICDEICENQWFLQSARLNDDGLSAEDCFQAPAMDFSAPELANMSYFAGWVCKRVKDVSASKTSMMTILRLNEDASLLLYVETYVEILKTFGVEEMRDGPTEFYVFPWVTTLVAGLDVVSSKVLKMSQCKKFGNFTFQNVSKLFTCGQNFDNVVKFCEQNIVAAFCVVMEQELTIVVKLFLYFYLKSAQKSFLLSECKPGCLPSCALRAQGLKNSSTLELE